MSGITSSLPESVAALLDEEARRRGMRGPDLALKLILQGLPSGGKNRRIPFAGIVSDPGLVPGDQVKEELAASWADHLDSELP